MWRVGMRCRNSLEMRTESINSIKNLKYKIINKWRRVKEADKDLSDFLATNINDLDEVKYGIIFVVLTQE